MWPLDWRMELLDPPPLCFSSSLKRISVGEFVGTEEEMLALRILLRTAIVLEELVLQCSRDHLKGFDEYWIEYLAELDRPEHCRLHLVCSFPALWQDGERHFVI